ncbi:type 1 glutamine amidotransferase [Chitinophaga sp. LS1]|uniref:type 1 glutamine amidotransferase n=1 Tax=Chitinophaga sp. LS1 TaxID=3051176 RepID=UPI002AAB2893|nr:gamma-glutamyl-gamma-aminobutyrate hydrolase family protein [Chitinophaga sp. LS1]WPV66845.1 gamma-glutamyl-gamma-aminobutyrate hydrolase family protein [Chitinophaga sp. LS1]
MHIQIFMHVPFEGPGCIIDWINSNTHEVTYTHWYNHPNPPAVTDFDFLIVMGGPMGIHDESEYPWLAAEKAIIRQAILDNKPVLGICLGAQLIAHVLGAKVYANEQREIGWYPVQFSPYSPVKVLPQEAMVFHWHGDTFDLPAGAGGFAASAATPNQAFVYKEKVIALQFHFEVTQKSLESMLQHGEEELVAAPYVQERSLILDLAEFIPENNELMYGVLDYLAGVKY